MSGFSSVTGNDPQVVDVANLTPTDNGVIIGNGTNFVVESGATLKTSIDLVNGQLTATATNDEAAAGKVGEYKESEILIGTPVSLTTATAADVTSLSLEAGDWEVYGNVSFTAGAGTVPTLLIGWISDVSATNPTKPNKGAYNQINTTFGTAAAQSLPTGSRRFSLASTTTIYLGTLGAFTVNTLAAYGILCARRVR